MKTNTVKFKQATFLAYPPFPFVLSLLLFCLLFYVSVCYPRDPSARDRNLFTNLSIQAASKRSLNNLARESTQTLPNTFSITYLLNTSANLGPMSVQPQGRTEQSDTAPLLMFHCNNLYFWRYEGGLVFLGLGPLCVSRQNILCCRGYCSPAVLRLL